MKALGTIRNRYRLIYNGLGQQVLFDLVEGKAVPFGAEQGAQKRRPDGKHDPLVTAEVGEPMADGSVIPTLRKGGTT